LHINVQKVFLKINVFHLSCLSSHLTMYLSNNVNFWTFANSQNYLTFSSSQCCMLLFRFIIISQLIYICNDICQFTILLVDRLWAWKLSNVISLSNAFQSTFEWCTCFLISKGIFLNFYITLGLIQRKCNSNYF